MILHIPHSSFLVPPNLRDQFVLSDVELLVELDLMTDAFAEDLIAYPAASTVWFPSSRPVVDVERFPDDSAEPMSRVGMGMIYARTAAGGVLQRQIAGLLASVSGYRVRAQWTLARGDKGPRWRRHAGEQALRLACWVSARLCSCFPPTLRGLQA